MLDPAIMAFLMAIAPTPAEQAGAIMAEQHRVVAGFPVPAEHALTLKTMGGPCPKCRDRATRRLIRASNRDLRSLAHALAHRDPEVRWRAEKALAYLSRCRGCLGEGECPEYRSDYNYRDPRCRNCGQASSAHYGDPPRSPVCLRCVGTGLGWRFLL